jgi:hypothetical protein
MKNSILISSILMLAFQLSAQRIYFCDNYTSSGEPIGANTKLTCPAEGGYVYVLLNNGSSNMPTDKVYLYVDKLTTSEYVPFDVKDISADKSKNWVVYDYKFASPGDYRITFKDANMKELAKDYVSLVPKETESTSTSDDDYIDYDDPTSMFYYTYSTVEACVGIDTYSGTPNTVSTAFTIDRNLGGRIYFKINNPGKDIHTDQFVVYINKNDAAGVSQTFDTKYYSVNSSSRSWDYFYYDFYSDGDYTISVYTKDFVFINTTSINLTYSN